MQSSSNNNPCDPFFGETLLLDDLKNHNGRVARRGSSKQKNPTRFANRFWNDGNPCQRIHLHLNSFFSSPKENGRNFLINGLEGTPSNHQPKRTTTWRIIPFSKWLKTHGGYKSPKDRVSLVINGLVYPP